MDTKKIGIFLKELRNKKGMTQEQLGEMVGVSNKTISRWETGNYMPPVDCLNMLGSITKLMGFRIPHIINSAHINEF